MNFRRTLGTLAMTAGMLLVNPVLALATPHFTLNPTSGSQTVGQNFTVIMGIDSDTSKVIGVDMVASFDSSKLEVVSVEKATFPDDAEHYFLFSYSPGQTIIHNDTGKFEVTLTPISQSVLTGPVVKQDLLKVTFRPKAVGTATLNYTCTAANTLETNIIDQSGNDVVDCAANQSGSYTIAAGTGGDPTSAPVATMTPATTTTSSLPQTGGVENTIALMIFGISSIGIAMYFKLV